MDTIASLFSFITTPVAWIIVQFHKLYGAIFGPDTGWAWGLSIMSLVIVIRICLIPLFVKQIKATRAMQTLQPEMKKIQERYKNDRQRQSEEMMKLYKETGTNPLSSCLPILAQSPFFFALYHVLNNIANGKTVGKVINQDLLESAQQAHIFGAPLAAKFTNSAEKVQSLGATLTDVRVVTAIMIILMSLSQFYTQRQLMTKNVDTTVKTPFMQQQKMLMYVFPVIFAVFGINFPVGVLVYWLTTNVWTMGQQMYVIHNNPTPGSKAQAAYLERLTKHVTHHGKVRRRSERTIIKAIVAKGRDRNEFERKFINGLSKAGFAAQPDGTVVKGESAVAVETAEDGTPTTASGTPRRQQPKRQTKAQRQSGAAKAADEATSLEKTSLEKSDEPEDAAPAAQKKAAPKQPGSGRSKAQSGQRKGPQRPKSPSKK
ncbi:YidC/Oxa1 family membrane protein insertase [Streptomyces sp. SAI-170]|uniref:membrane protein insertase YidC n=1 Tax=Streptomyces sp. SAI-170 TaxID=3377729 RepID=UPI003C7D0790